MNAQQEPCGAHIISNTHSVEETICDFTGLIPDTDPSTINEVDIYFIPVVVHVIHDDGPENVDEAEIEAEIELLNVNFNGEGNDTNDTKIQFILAKVDPFGNCTTGIVKKQDPIANNIVSGQILGPVEEIKTLSFWDSQKYLNIWIVREIDGAFTGYSTVPFIPEPSRDGIVMQYTDLGSETLTHEVGHYLGLLHVWGCDDDCKINDCGLSDDEADELNDFVIDTNPAILWFVGEEGQPISCAPSTEGTCQECPVFDPESGEELMVFSNRNYPKSNYMSYFIGCRNNFTGQQMKRFYYFLNNVRRDLWYPGYIIKKEMIVDQETKFHKDVDIYPGGKLIIKAEAIMAEGTSIIVHQGGQLIVEGGKIRACSISEDERSKWNGIHVEGRGAEGYDVELLGATIEDVDGFAVNLVADHNATPIFPNGQLKAIRSIFNNVDGLANFASIKTRTNNSIIDFCTQNGGEFGVSNTNTLDIEIKNSQFYDIEDVCVSTTGGSFSIEANEFYSDNIDIALTHLFPGEPTTITNGNLFKGNFYGIRASGATKENHLIEGNIFSGQEFDRDNPISYFDRDIYMDGITDYTINDNDFFGLIGVSSRATVNTTISGANSVSNNEFRGNLTGIYPHASNPNYSFSDNCFATRTIDARIEGAMQNQGQQGGDPPNNCFTNQGVPSAGYTVVDIGGSPDVFDYVVPVLDNIDCRNALLAPGVGVIILDTDDDPGSDCMNGGRDRNYNFSNPSENIDKVLYEQMDLIGSSINTRDFVAARVALNQIDQSTIEGVDANFIGQNLIQLYEGLNNNNDNSNLVLNLKSIAMKEHPSSGYAQAFHYFLTGEFVDNLDLTFLENDEVVERQADLKLNNSVSKEITIFPNPANDYIRLTNSENVLTLKVYNSVGELIHNSKALSVINTVNWTNGIYIFSIELIDGSSTTKKIIVSK